MVNFISLKFIKEYHKVVYYSVVVNGEPNEVSLFEDFITKHTPGNKEKLNHILA